MVAEWFRTIGAKKPIEDLHTAESSGSKGESRNKEPKGTKDERVSDRNPPPPPEEPISPPKGLYTAMKSHGAPEPIR